MRIQDPPRAPPCNRKIRALLLENTFKSSFFINRCANVVPTAHHYRLHMEAWHAHRQPTHSLASPEPKTHNQRTSGSSATDRATKCDNLLQLFDSIRARRRKSNPPPRRLERA